MWVSRIQWNALRLSIVGLTGSVERLSLHTKQLERKMSALDDKLAAIKASQAATVTKIAAVKTDLETVLGKIANFPDGGLTADQQNALVDIEAHSEAISDSLSAIDTEANPPATSAPPFSGSGSTPAPAPNSAPTPAPGTVAVGPTASPPHDDPAPPSDAPATDSSPAQPGQ